MDEAGCDAGALAEPVVFLSHFKDLRDSRQPTLFCRLAPFMILTKRARSDKVKGLVALPLHDRYKSHSDAYMPFIA